MSEQNYFDGRALLEALVREEVSFILIGGFAVIAHGYARATKDIDLVPEPTESNFDRLLTVLADLDYSILGTEEFEPDEIVHPDLEALCAGGSWVLNTRFGRLDILQFLEPDLRYEHLAEGAFWEEVFGHRIRFCSYENLILMKKAAGRAQDLADIEQLRAIRNENPS